MKTTSWWRPECEIPPSAEKSDRVWSGLTGRLNEGEVKRWLKRLEGPEYYIAGPPALVAAMQQMLKAGGVREEDIRSDEFAGYE